MNVKFNSDKWCELTGIIVYDPDGWDRYGDLQADWDKEIDFDTFINKASSSTTNRWPYAEIDQLKLSVFEKLNKNS